MELESSRIVISRPFSSRNGKAFAVRIDGQEKGEVRVGDDLTVDVEPGPHVVEVQYGRHTRPRAKVQAESGSEARVMISSLGLRVEYPQDPSKTSVGALADLLRQELTLWPKRKTRDVIPAPAGPDPDTGLDEPTWKVVQDANPGDVALEPENVVIDNSASDTAVTHEVRRSQQWTRTWSVDTERSGKVAAGISIPAHFKAQAEAVLRHQYSSSAQEMQQIEHTVTVVVPPRTTTTVSFTWRKVRLAGEVTMTQRQIEISAPFETVIGMSLDYSQSEAPGGAPSYPTATTAKP